MTLLCDRGIQNFFEENGRRNHRSFVILLGENGKAQIPAIHRILQGHTNGSVESIVWCHKNEVTRKTGQRVSGKRQKKRIEEEESQDDLALFIRARDIEFIEYRESERILGRTVDMLILQDFEALSPNLIATSMETVRGGGAIVLLLDTAHSIETLISHKTDLHEKIGEFEPRYNKRLFKSLISSNFALFLDDKLNVLDCMNSPKDKNLKVSKDKYEEQYDPDSEVLKSLGKTRDQIYIIEEIFKALESRAGKTVFSITASRGRGKSAALGISIAKAISLGLLSVYIASPAIENVKTVFLFLITGLEKLGYKKYIDFKIIYQFRGNKRFMQKIEFTGGRKHIIEYFNPANELKYYPDLLVVDEAAAIPLVYLTKLIFPNFVIMATTVNGYEGTGRAFSVKLSEMLRKSSAESSSFIYKELTMKESIRYGQNDPVENWLYKALLLDASVPKIQGCPRPSECSLFYVNKDVLFSGKPPAEKFLNDVFSLFISSHYKNSPNDLQVLADSPRHEIFALVTPAEDDGKDIPKVICSLQISFEGKCTRTGHLREGNLIPWVISEEHIDASFLNVYGIRIVRIAVHPEYAGMGYGTASLNLLIKHLSSHGEDICSMKVRDGEKDILLQNITDVLIPQVSWIGASFGMAETLCRFWLKNQFVPVGVKQAVTQETGEHSAVFIRSLSHTEEDRIYKYNQKFMSRFVGQLSSSFKSLGPSLSLSLLKDPVPEKGRMMYFPYDDISRIRMASGGKIDLNLVTDIIPDISRMYFHGMFSQDLSVLRKSVLLMVGCQNRSIDEIAELLTLKPFQIVNILTKVLSILLEDLEKNHVMNQER
ncbi:putative P-loop ATPase/acetyltransferase fusion [Encephalitozoon intestinalis ATCC 50506]|uniref:P-loop ATPase/acetyltransferase fusion n=1 Tax=Encephalitozoon intestinalis (strain ATCC 50506) TaxID=876142 RepID=E0S9G5_ENCIT|nr:putative P-loop ATPase/acetyltransferase fusion [Encephalitozoon intestinalis ATCC 50506]ADM12350.1 putative P-loop ATPase/acetyltransferase fusion [Encephalitozoon intestinalis ATCC 50506]UTX46180.1 tRNA (Met) cytidine acetyltransferase [Encephalitozoon intestinalis]